MKCTDSPGIYNVKLQLHKLLLHFKGNAFHRKLQKGIFTVCENNLSKAVECEHLY